MTSERPVVVVADLEPVVERGLFGTPPPSLEFLPVASAAAAIEAATRQSAAAVVVRRRDFHDVAPAVSATVLGVSSAAYDVYLSYRGELSSLTNPTPEQLLQLVFDSPGG